MLYHVHVEQFLILRHQRILWFNQNLDEHRFRERVEWDQDRKTADELGNHSELDQIACFHL